MTGLPGSQVVGASPLAAPSPRSSSHVIEEANVGLADGTLVPVLVKHASPHGLLGDAERVRPAFLFHSDRELEFYRCVLDSGRLGTARLYDAVAVEDGWRLVLEQVDGAPLEETGFGPLWHAAAHWLGRFHRANARTPVACEAVLLRYDRDFFALWPERAHALATSATASARDRDRLRDLARRYGPIAEALADMPSGLIHGDFHPANILVSGGGSGVRVCPVDWELAGRGPLLLDLAALTSGDWPKVERAAVVDTYLEACGPLSAEVASPPSERALGEMLDLCALHLAMQWLGWGPGWTPESRRNTDWMQVATDCATRLGV